MCRGGPSRAGVMPERYPKLHSGLRGVEDDTIPKCGMSVKAINRL